MFDIKKTIEKGLRGLISGGIAAAFGWFAANGITVGDDVQAQLVFGLTGLALGVIAAITNFLKWKFPKLAGWL